MCIRDSNYEALVSGDGACAGCGEKSVLRAVASVTEAYMRPIFHKKAKRLREVATELENNGLAKLAALKARSEDEYKWYTWSVAHSIMGLGGENDDDGASPQRALRQLREQAELCGRVLSLFEDGALLLDEVDLILPTLAPSRLNGDKRAGVNPVRAY